MTLIWIYLGVGLLIVVIGLTCYALSPSSFDIDDPLDEVVLCAIAWPFILPLLLLERLGCGYVWLVRAVARRVGKGRA